MHGVGYCSQRRLHYLLFVQAAHGHDDCGGCTVATAVVLMRYNRLSQMLTVLDHLLSS